MSRLGIERAPAIAALSDQSETQVRRGKLTGVLGADLGEQMANQMIHHGGPCRDDLQAVCACAVSVLKKSAPAVIDVLASNV